MNTGDWAIVCHGGAGNWRPGREAEAVEGVTAACDGAADLLAGGGSALDAVVACVTALEDMPLFNAGTGSCLTVDGRVQMDAAVMTGADLRTGAVAGIEDVKNPVQVARRVMEETDHVLLGGAGALRFARACGFAEHDPVTAERRERWRETMDALRAGEDDDPARSRLRALLERYPELTHGTVGAVARDASGGLAAAVSTGGVSLKLAGRIGDSPVPGAGNYATPAGAAGATGQGELILRRLTTKEMCDHMEAGGDAARACAHALERLQATVGAAVGVIAVDARGRIGAAHGTQAMPHAFRRAGGETVARMTAEPDTGQVDRDADAAGPREG